MAPPRSYRRAARPLYPGVLLYLVAGLAGFYLYQIGFRLPLTVPIYVKVALEVVVAYLVWKAWKYFRAALKSQLRLFNAQAMLSYAVALQALILLLRS